MYTDQRCFLCPKETHCSSGQSHWLQRIQALMELRYLDSLPRVFVYTPLPLFFFAAASNTSFLSPSESVSASSRRSIYSRLYSIRFKGLLERPGSPQHPPRKSWATRETAFPPLCFRCSSSRISLIIRGTWVKVARARSFLPAPFYSPDYEGRLLKKFGKRLSPRSPSRLAANAPPPDYPPRAN